MGAYSGQPQIKEWFAYTFWQTLRDYWLNAKTQVSRWQTERDSDVGKFFTKFKLVRKMR